MKMSKVFFVFLFLFFCAWAQTQAQIQTVNKWEYGYNAASNVDSSKISTYFYYSGHESSMVFANYGWSVASGEVNYLQVNWVKDLVPWNGGDSTKYITLPDTIFLDGALMSWGNIKGNVDVFVFVQGRAWTGEYQDQFFPLNNQRKKLYWDMKRVKQYMTRFFRVYLGFHVYTGTPSYTWNEVQVFRLGGIKDGKKVIYDYFGDTTLVGLQNNPEQIPKEFVLYQNYPNPFNPTTNIKFDLPKESNVTLKVYNILGEEVAALVNKVMPAGHQVVTFDALRLASGMYIYRIQAGSFTEVKKMLLMK